MLKEFYEKNYKKLLIIPALLLIFSLIVVGNKVRTTGGIADGDISLTGGLSVTVFTDKEFDVSSLEKELIGKLNEEITVRRLSDFTSKRQIGFIIETGNPGIEASLKEELRRILEIKLDESNYSVEEMESSLGQAFYKSMVKALLVSFILMGVVIFIGFRKFIPSMAVILSAFLDIIVTLAIINLIGMELSMGGIAALLLIIGYSVDTDVLLNTRTLKQREGSIIDNIASSVKTGLTMTATTIAAISVGYFFTSSLLLKDMFLILLIALVIDVISTYLMNAGILYWYLEGKK